MSLAYRIKNSMYQFYDLEKTFTLINQGGYYSALNVNTNRVIIDKLQKSLNALIEKGLRETIVKKYLGNDIQ
jgi:hypothetical protein